jgi:hypothetical protein
MLYQYSGLENYRKHFLNVDPEFLLAFWPLADSYFQPFKTRGVHGGIHPTQDFVPLSFSNLVYLYDMIR